MEKYCTGGQAADDSTAREHYMLDPRATNDHSEYVILNCFSTATVVARTRLNTRITVIRTLPVIFSLQ